MAATKYEARSARTTADKNPKQIQRTKIRIPKNEIAAHSSAFGMTRGECSELLYESLIIGVGADPKPDYYVLISDAQGAPADTYPYGICFAFSADSFELQAGVVCIVFPELVAAAGGALDVIGKSPKTFQKVVGQV